MSAPEGNGSVEVEGRRLAWAVSGAGPPLLLVNGYAASGADWDPQFLAGLARAFEVVCPDNRGTGRSELGVPAEVGIDGMAADLEALLDALGIESAAVVGWSMGGFVAQRLAARAPRRVEALVLLATDAGAGAVAAAPDVLECLCDHTSSPREQAGRLISVLFPPTLAPEVDRRFGDLVATARAAIPTETLLAQEAAMDAWHAAEQARPGEGAPPVLAACGSEDMVIPPPNTDLVAAHWPGSRVERFAGAGHAFMAQEPEHAADMIRSFLGR